VGVQTATLAQGRAFFAKAEDFLAGVPTTNDRRPPLPQSPREVPRKLSLRLCGESAFFWFRHESVSHAADG
jgi:hypothetical protein